MRRILSLLLILLSLTAAALAEETFFPLPDGPTEIRLTFRADALDIHDETRLRELNALIGHIGLTCRVDPAAPEGTWSGLFIDVDGETLADFTACENGEASRLRLPGSETVWQTAGESPVEALFPEITLDNALAGLPLTMLSDGDALLDAVTADRDAFGIGAEKQSINGYGSTVTRWTLRADSGEEIRRVLLDAAPADWMRQLLAGVTFADGCEFYLLCDKEDVPVKVVFRGTIVHASGTYENSQLTWRRKRAPEDNRNGFELKLPKNGAAFTLSFRETDKTKNGVRTITVSDFTLTQTVGGETLKTTGDPIKLQIREGRITGTLKFRTGVLNKTKLTDVSQLALDVTVEPDGHGEIIWSWKHKANQEAWSGTVSFAPLTETDWERFDTEAVPMPETEEERAEIRARMTEAFSRLLVARLVLVDPADTLYLRKGLDDAAWDEIVSAAEAVVNH